ncbi:hypothetical protein APHWI1_0215 [Anaplasma phagocytophilum str. ApWI1]|uniref:Uncharacterized protein n=1 Tax=Anaplasma phagocytophilum str. ApWI1 TaxID=1359155 RepID=A0A0F3PZE5_ANAPH|nr:hypothetical protein APHWEB_1299 [Anaplasma phagocytophilum str. Webster]KJV82426.1 hypothetical protein APHHGE2_1013 [Anaplasma phagocytophilum str. HGE2]KJV85377.1 hypothetical protein APHWI1_0215 [Anaplasma phagocytophilum str. ApWI1]KJV87264.1 hypothetical protein APHNYW_0726 [Anaplasma phagocytophilum str. ApNYW]KJV98652.1 hypothetical protein OTSANNIE_0986 [Anaplasma phagocytophilum str. Annie]KJZ99280.1 hypothetical protein APHCR_0227 [Anaplasma phagocytophilum str. CR1007]KKA00167.
MFAYNLKEVFIRSAAGFHCGISEQYFVILIGAVLFISEFHSKSSYF